ncbi:hypothetical protein BC835DRAFT_1413011 [Cytidiella melzeri]|nr:hypothetical protein BC835DRAFT_1413011 [Cytidiella melzeri]
MQQPTLKGFIQLGKSLRTNKRRCDNTNDAETPSKKKIKDKTIPATKARSSACRDSQQFSPKPTAVQTTGFATSSPGAGPSNTGQNAHKAVIDFTSRDSPQVSYLPTPVTAAKRRPAATSTSKATTSKAEAVSRLSPFTSLVATPAATIANHSHAQLATPITPARRRSTRAKAADPSSPLSSPPPTPAYKTISPLDNRLVAPISNAIISSQTIVPSSQTQVIEYNPFLSSNSTHSNDHEGKFKLPLLPERLRPAILPSSAPNYESDEETCVIPSSQTQELVLENFSASPSRPRQQEHLTNRLHTACSSLDEIIPDSQAVDTDFASSPILGRARAVSSSSAMSDSRKTSAQCGTSRESTQREIVPTSQCAIEEEITSSDLLDIKARLPATDNLSDRRSSGEAVDGSLIVAENLTRSPTRARFLPLPTEPRTPSRSQRTFGKDANVEGLPCMRPGIAPIQHLQRTPRTPKTPQRVRFSKDEVTGRREAVPESSQTEPESSQWHVSTQYTPRKHAIESSQTEPESSQWRVPTQYTPTKHQIQTSQTEPESSQWRVQTQYTTCSRRKRDASEFDDGDEGLQLASTSFSLPVASYHDSDYETPPPSYTFLRRGSSYLLEGVQALEESCVDPDDGGLIPGASSFDLSQVSEGVSRRIAQYRATRLKHGDRSQPSMSGAPLSAPNDHNDCFSDGLSQPQEY